MLWQWQLSAAANIYQYDRLS